MDEVVDLGFCSLEYRRDFMIAIVRAGHTIDLQDSHLVAQDKRKRLGDTATGLVLYAPPSAGVDITLYEMVEELMETQGYSFLVVANPNPKRQLMLELLRDYCSVRIAGTLEEAIAHAEELTRMAVCG